MILPLATATSRAPRSFLTGCSTDQYNAYTTETFKWLGEAFGVSPAKLEYMVNQYSGGLLKRMLATGEQWAGINNAAYRMNSIPGIGTLFSQTEHRFSRAEDTVHDIEFQLGRLSGSGLLTACRAAPVAARAA